MPLGVSLAREMKNEENKMSEENAAAQNVAPADAVQNDERFPSELSETRWSVITYETVAASGLSYPEAADLAAKLKSERVSGICIITDDAAERIKG